MANASGAARAADHISAPVSDSADRLIDLSWHGPRHLVAELTDDDMWAVVEGDPRESDDDADEDDGWDLDDDDEYDDYDDDDDWN